MSMEEIVGAHMAAKIDNEIMNGTAAGWTITITDNTDTTNSPALKWEYYISEPIIVGCFPPITKHEEVFEMQVYDVVVVDTKECEVLLRQQVIAEDEKAAMLELDITDDIKKKQRKGQAKFIFNQIGGFNRYTRKVRIKEEDE